ncbi:MAG TPA: hypothetical protein VG936_02780 [Lacunisphaera sp.]|nr:hypothetical protein [Lacunisphaera sp.]
MAGYSANPLWKKLGYKPGTCAWVHSAPRHYRELLQLPDEVSVKWLARPGATLSLAHVFITDSAALRRQLPALRRQIVPDGMIWVSWPKKTSGVASDVTEDTVRAVALPLGLVDIKVCAVDDVWSGLKLVIRRSER